MSRAGPLGCFGDGSTFDGCDGRRHTDDDTWPVPAIHPDSLQEQPNHPLRDVEVGDSALAEWPHGDDVARRPTDHLPRLVAHRQYVLRAAIERDDGRLVQDDALAPRVHERVRRAEIDREVASQGQSPSRGASRRVLPEL